MKSVSFSRVNLEAELRSCRRNLAAVRASAHVAARPPTPPAGLVNMARTDAPAAVCTRKTSPETEPKEARTAFGTREPSKRRQTGPTTAAPAKESTGLKFGWVKKKCSTLPPSLWWPDQGDPAYLPRPTVLGPEEGRCRKQRRRWRLLFRRFLPSFVVLLS